MGAEYSVSAEEANIALINTPEWGMEAAMIQQLRDAGMPVKKYPEEFEGGDLRRVVFLICWQAPEGLFAKLPNLKAIQVPGAGVDGVLRDPSLPPDVPLLRITDPLMAQRMATWCLWAVINIQRKMDEYFYAQLKPHWDKMVEEWQTWDNADVRVGILGLGVMGAAVSDLLLSAGYTVSSWTRNPRPRQGVTGYSGQEGVKPFAAASDIIICLLPLTPDTRGRLNAEFFSWMPKGGAVINCGRGPHLVPEDLIGALDTGHLSSAVLDVFDQEPLPLDSPLWKHPKIRVFPHVSSMTNIGTATLQIVDHWKKVMAGEPIDKKAVVDRTAGY